MDISAIYSKLVLNKTALFPILVTLLLTGCASSAKDQPMSFCEYVDPNSKYYAPNTLSLEQLNTCRIQAEKILAIQLMQIKINGQRAQVISSSPTASTRVRTGVSNDNNEINQALNQLSNQPVPTPTNVNTRSTTPTSPNSRRTSQNARIAAANQNLPTVIAQNTHTPTNTSSVQQHFLDNGSTDNRTSTVNSALSTQRQNDGMQAQLVAEKVSTLLQSEPVQSSLNQPRSVLPGEEIKGDIINQINSRANSAPVASDNKALMSSAQVDKVSTEPPPARQTSESILTNITNRNIQPNVTQAKQATPPTSVSVESSTPAPQNKKPSTDYTLQPPTPITETSASLVNPVAQIVKPTESIANTQENKAKVDNYEATPLPDLNGTGTITSPANNPSIAPDPLAHLQQNRTENK